MRKLNGQIIGTILRITGCGFRFSKDYRWGVTMYHRIVFRVISTVDANYTAGINN
jgi:hypothetical protein